jgi:hypothetical protein
VAGSVVHAPGAYCYDAEMELTLGIWVNPRLTVTQRRVGGVHVPAAFFAGGGTKVREQVSRFVGGHQALTI